MAEAKQRKLAFYREMKNKVLTLEVAPGSSLDEAELSEAYGISRTPLREALRDLAGEGYLDLNLNRSTRVAELNYVTLRQFFQAAPLVYGIIHRLAAENRTSAQLDALRKAQQRFENALVNEGPRERTLCNNRFHEITGEMAGNIYFRPSFQRLLIDHARIGMTFYAPHDQGMEDNLDTACAQHDEIIEALEARDGAQAERLAIAHWKLSRDEMERFVMPAALQAPEGTEFTKK